ncbi:MAG: hypothetical protein JW803_07060 [Endomicrobiales bacterium]|nr:hypothetical protein [Endomicrobiales bacterium]
MDRFLTLFFQDVILLSAGIVLLVALGILIWIIKSLTSGQLSQEDYVFDEPQAQAPPHASDGLIEARLQELSSQINEILFKIDNIEKKLKEQGPFDKTIPALVGPADLERLAKRLETKLDSAPAAPAGTAHSDIEKLAAIEAKIEGIHKLLILLSDSNK